MLVLRDRIAAHLRVGHGSPDESEGPTRMALTADHFKALVRRHIEGDDEGFYSVALQVAARAAKEGKNRFAQDLRELIDTAKDDRASTAVRPVPMAQP